MTQSTTGLVELKPCPFCGDEAEVGRYGTSRHSTIYACTMCGCQLETGEEWEGGQTPGGPSWNTRPTDPTIAELVAALEDYRSQFGQALDANDIAYGPAQQAAEDRAVAVLTKSRSAP